MKTFNLLIAGGRDFNDFNLLMRTVDDALRNKVVDNYKINIVSGTANGADILGEKYANARGYDIVRFPAQWDSLDEQPCKIRINKSGKKYNVLAGHNRNKKMIEYIKNNGEGGVILFWDGESKGTENTKTLAEENQIRTIVISYQGEM